MSFQETFKLFQNALDQAKSVVLIGHIAPDGDCLGALLALQSVLEQYKTWDSLDSVIVGLVPEIYHFLPKHKELLNPDSEKLINQYDIAISVDCATYERMGISKNLFDASKLTINIDHHISNTNFANINIVDYDACSTGQVIFYILQYLNLKITDHIATNLYTSLLTDTGGFKFSNTNAKCLETSSILVNYGASPNLIYRECYENKPLVMIKLHSSCLSKLSSSADQKVFWSFVSRDMLNDIGAKDEHIEGIVEQIRQIDTCEVAILFKETKDGKVKISLRSKNINVSEFTKQYDGGGHHNAAGCTLSHISLSQAIDEISKKVIDLVLSS